MQPAAFFAADGYYNTAPGSTLSLVIQPNYYDAIVRARPLCVERHLQSVIAYPEARGHLTWFCSCTSEHVRTCDEH
jgi:hypothetical protein